MKLASPSCIDDAQERRDQALVNNRPQLNQGSSVATAINFSHSLQYIATVPGTCTHRHAHIFFSLMQTDKHSYPRSSSSTRYHINNQILGMQQALSKSRFDSDSEQHLRGKLPSIPYPAAARHSLELILSAERVFFDKQSLQKCYAPVTAQSTFESAVRLSSVMTVAQALRSFTKARL